MKIIKEDEYINDDLLIWDESTWNILARVRLVLAEHRDSVSMDSDCPAHAPKLYLQQSMFVLVHPPILPRSPISTWAHSLLMGFDPLNQPIFAQPNRIAHVINLEYCYKIPIPYVFSLFKMKKNAFSIC